MSSLGVRAFVALELPEPVRATLERAISQARAGAPGKLAWTAPEKLHLTLAFLGPCPAATLDALREALRARLRGKTPLDLSLAGHGLFPGPQRPAVLWVGVHGEGLLALQADVAQSCRAVGLALEARPFVPHLTCARVRARGAAGALAAHWTGQPPLAQSWTQDTVSLMRSDPGPGGAVYTAIERFALHG